MATSTQQILREAGFIKKPKQLEKPMTRISGGPVDSLAWILRGVDLDEFKNKEKSKKEQSRETGKEDSTPGFEPDFTHKIARLYVQSIYQLTSTQSMSSLSNTFLGDKEIPDLEYLQRFISTYCQVNLNSHFTLQSVMLVGLANILSFTKLFSVRANLDKTSMQKNGLDPVLASELTSYLNEFASNHTRICETEIPPLESSLLEEAKTRWTMTKSRHSRHRSERLDSPGRVKSPKTKENTHALPSVTKQVVTGTNEHSVLSPTAVNTPATKIQLFDFSGQAVSQHNRGKSVPVKPNPGEELTRQSALLRKDSDDSPVVRHKKKEDLIDATSIFPRSPRLAPDPLVQPATRMQTVPAALAVYLPKQLHRSLNGLQLALAEAKTQREEL